LAGQAKRRLRKAGGSWRADETYVRVKGEWRYLYRAVDKAGKTIDFYLSVSRDEQSAYRFFLQAMRLRGCPQKICIDGSAANKAALERINRERATAKLRPIEIRQSRYLNNLIEQDHRAVKRIVRPMMGFKSLVSAAATLAGIELAHMLRKGQLKDRYSQDSYAQQFDALAA
jgi:transposase-like protein